MKFISIKDLAHGVYTDGFRNIKKLPPDYIDRILIAKAIAKRSHKAQRNIKINANAWIGSELGVPLPKISL